MSYANRWGYVEQAVGENVSNTKLVRLQTEMRDTVLSMLAEQNCHWDISGHPPPSVILDGFGTGLVAFDTTTMQPGTALVWDAANGIYIPCVLAAATDVEIDPAVGADRMDLICIEPSTVTTENATTLVRTSTGATAVQVLPQYRQVAGLLSVVKGASPTDFPATPAGKVPLFAVKVLDGVPAGPWVVYDLRRYPHQRGSSMQLHFYATTDGSGDPDVEWFEAHDSIKVDHTDMTASKSFAHTALGTYTLEFWVPQDVSAACIFPWVDNWNNVSEVLMCKVSWASAIVGGAANGYRAFTLTLSFSSSGLATDVVTGQIVCGVTIARPTP